MVCGTAVHRSWTPAVSTIRQERVFHLLGLARPLFPPEYAQLVQAQAGDL